ncbi:MAG: DUF2244 domain-containing protein [Gammaproteobacteria bacterium]|nr:DUF2244 domain-containing protein [Gammaproteobacteria bacterium]
MIAVQCDPVTAEGQFVIRPNRSLSWRGTLVFFAWICTLSILIAGGFALMGAWLILPFAALDLLILGASLYIVACRGWECEVVSIRGDTVEVQKGRYRPQQSFQLSRHWARVVLSRSADDWYPSRLTIRSHGREVEVGACLVEEERQKLARELSSAIGQRAAVINRAVG